MRYLLSYMESTKSLIHIGDVFYHSSTYYFENPKVGKDSVFWTAKNKIIARCYIFDWNNHNALESNEFLSKFGLNGKVRKDEKNPKGFRIIYNKKSPFYKKTNLEKIKILDKIIKKNKIKIKKVGEVIHYDNGKYITVDKNEYAVPAYTYEFIVKDNLKIFDMTKNKPTDVDNVDFLNSDRLEELIESGYDGVHINDFTKDDTFGLIPHRSFGFFKKGLSKIDIVKVTEDKHPSKKEIMSIINKK